MFLSSMTFLRCSAVLVVGAVAASACSTPAATSTQSPDIADDLSITADTADASVDTPSAADTVLTDAAEADTKAGDTAEAADASDAGGKDTAAYTVWKFVDMSLAGGVKWKHHSPNGDGGVNLYDHGAGLATGDFNGDGHDDLLALGQCGKVGYYLGKGDGTFTDSSNLLAQLNDGLRVAVTYGDYDEDGDIDFYVTFVLRPHALLRQNADGTFTDVGEQAGVAVSGHYSGAAFVDVNKDGYLDLIVAGNKRHTTKKVMTSVPDCPTHFQALPANDVYGTIGSDPSALFINGGPSKQFAFVNEAVARGIPQIGNGGKDLGFGDVVVADLDLDNAPDLLLPEMFGDTRVLHNDGKGFFVDKTDTWMPRRSFGPAGASVSDLNGDGWPDIFLTDMHSDMGGEPGILYSSIDPAKRWLDLNNKATGDNASGPFYGNTLFVSSGAAAWTESDLAWKAETYQPWGHVIADFDNDGLLDAFLPAGMSNPFDYFPNALLHNLGTSFERIETTVGLDPPPAGKFDPVFRVAGQPLVASSRSAATADFDEDGALDLVVMNWHQQLNIFRNELPAGKHWLDVRLAGKAPHQPYGARVKVQAGGKSYVHLNNSAAGYLSQSSQWLHFGLGAAAKVDSVTVTWPDGKTTVVNPTAIDQRLIISQ